MKSEIKKEEMRIQTIFEAIGGTYQQAGDYLLPNIEVPESPQIGIWGQRRLRYLRTNKKVLYTTMLMGATEELKVNNQIEWIQRMNSIRNRAAEIVYKELIYA